MVICYCCSWNYCQCKWDEQELKKKQFFRPSLLQKFFSKKKVETIGNDSGSRTIQLQAIAFKVL